MNPAVYLERPTPNATLNSFTHLISDSLQEILMGNFNILPPEIILEILTRLPTESVLECKLVCKPWRNLVYLPCFSQMHLHHLTDHGKLTFLCKEYQQLNYLEYNEDHHEHNIRKININPPFKGCTIIGSCNGLICLNACHDSQLAAYICNPITKEYVILPKCNRYRNPRTSHLYDGFGYHRETNEYKVVRIHQLRGKPDLEYCVVYTLGSGSGWRDVGDFGLSASVGSPYHPQGVFVNDSLYWITLIGKIACFNLADEKFCEIPAVPCLSSGSFVRIGVLSGVLWCSNISFDDMDIANTATWLLKKNGSQSMMVKEQEKYLPSVTLGKEIVEMRPLSLMKSGELLCYNSKNLCSYDIKSCCSKTLMNFPQYVYQTIPHMNTLVSLKVLGEEDTKKME